MDFETQLRHALERKQPSQDFASRVIAAAKKNMVHSPAGGRWTRWALIPIAASILVLAAGLQQRRERMQGEAAKTQLMQALEITSGKLNSIEKKVRGVLK